jgi:hypothetical protein
MRGGDSLRTTMYSLKNIYFLLLAPLLLVAGGCGIYSFKDANIPAYVKTIRIQPIINKAPYVNPQLSPTLTERVRRKIVNQTKLTQTNNENADYDVSATITDYSVTTSGVSNKQETMNRLTISVEILRVDNTGKSTVPEQRFTVSRPFDFSARLSLQAAEAQLQDEIIRNLSDDIFNRLFSEW